jgi:hypothetical protein
MTLLAFEAHRVISLRMATAALGGARAQAEPQRMMVEKIFAAARVLAATDVRPPAANGSA